MAENSAPINTPTRLSRIPLPSLTGKRPVENAEASPAKLSKLETPQLRRVTASLIPENRRTSLLATPPGRKSSHDLRGKKKDLTESRIVVAVRKRPARGDEVDAVCVEGVDSLKVSYSRPKLDGISRQLHTHRFAFDRVYGEQHSTRQIYSDLVRPLVSLVASAAGGRATVFAYGQTGSGKTHTMFSHPDGLVSLACLDLLQAWERLPQEVDLVVSFYELYQGHLVDLLAERRRLQACEGRDGTIGLLGLTERKVPRHANAQGKLQEWLQQGLAQRVTGQTGANAASSRSHAILTLSIMRGKEAACLSRLSFIDLAGSERGADRQQVGHQTRLEGSEINKSLLALKECIRAMDRDAAHLPFRSSKLTMLLRDSLIGEHVRTAMLATISPSTATVEHTLNTLRYADRLRDVADADGPRQLGEQITIEDVELKGAEVKSRRTSYLPALEKTIADKTVAFDKALEKNAPEKPTPSKALDKPTPSKALEKSNASKSLEKPDSSKSSFASSKSSLPSTKPLEISLSRSTESGALEGIRKTLDSIWQLASECADEDVVQLMGEELSTLHQAFAQLN